MTVNKKNSVNKLRAMLERAKYNREKNLPAADDILANIRAGREASQQKSYFELLVRTDLWVQSMCRHMQMQHFCNSQNIPITDETVEFFEELYDILDDMGYDVCSLYNFLVDKYKLNL